MRSWPPAAVLCFGPACVGPSGKKTCSPSERDALVFKQSHSSIWNLCFPQGPPLSACCGLRKHGTQEKGSPGCEDRGGCCCEEDESPQEGTNRESCSCCGRIGGAQAVPDHRSMVRLETPVLAATGDELFCYVPVPVMQVQGYASSLSVNFVAANGCHITCSKS